MQIEYQHGHRVYKKSYRHCTSIYVINIIRINDKIPGNSNLLIQTRGCRVTIVTSTIYFKKWHIRYFDILCFPHNLHFHAVILLKIFLNLNYFGPRVQADPLWCVQIDFFFYWNYFLIVTIDDIYIQIKGSQINKTLQWNSHYSPTFSTETYWVMGYKLINYTYKMCKSLYNIYRFKYKIIGTFSSKTSKLCFAK